MSKDNKNEAFGSDPGGPSGGPIPALGAIGGGDRSYLLGRPRKRRHVGSQGSPSMSADSGFASVDKMARVNKGYVEYDEADIDPMFPDQEDEIEDMYFSDEIEPVKRTRKMPTTFRIIRPKTKGIAEIAYLDFPICENSLDFLIEREAVATTDFSNLEAGRWSENIVDFIGDGALALCDTISADTCALVMIIPALATNTIQIRLSERKAYSLIEEFRENPTPKLAKKMDNVGHNISRDIVDIIQRVIEAIPFAGEEWISFGLGRLGLPSGKWTAKALHLVAKSSAERGAKVGIKSGSEMFKDVIESIPKSVRFIFNIVPGLPSQGPIGNLFVDGLVAIGHMETEIRKYKEGVLAGEYSIDGKNQGSSIDSDGDGIPDRDEEDTEKEGLLGSLSIPEAEGCACPISESYEENKMNDNLLRQFIRSAVILEKKSKKKNDDKEEINPYGTGYMGYDPSLEDEESDEASLTQSYTTIYHPAKGSVTSHPREINETEEKKIRSLIRDFIFEEKERQVLAEPDEDDDDERDETEEASGAGAAGGYTLPLGMKPSGKKRKPSWKAAAGWGRAAPINEY